jgi:enoyl-CoA hydratase/carnithine racemase
MEGIRVELRGNASWITLDNPGVNALYPALISSLLGEFAPRTRMPASRPWS